MIKHMSSPHQSPAHLPEAVGGVVGVDIRPQLVHLREQVVQLVDVKALARTVHRVGSVVVVRPAIQDGKAFRYSIFKHSRRVRYSYFLG